MGFVLFAVLMASAFNQEGGGWLGQVFQNIFSYISGDKTLSDFLTEAGKNNSMLEDFFEDIAKDKFQKAFNLSAEELDALLGSGDELEKLLDGAGVDTSITLRDLQAMSPEELRQKIFTPEAVDKLLQHEKFGPFMVKQLFTNHEMARAVLDGMDGISDAAKDVLHDTIKNGAINRSELDKLLEDLRKGNQDPKTLIRERILELLPQKQRGALIMSELQDALSDQQKMEQYLTDHASEQFVDAEVSLQQTAAFLVTNREQLETILGNNGMQQLAQMIANKEKLPPLTDMQALLTHPNAARLREIMAARITDGNQVEQALTQLDFSMLPADLARNSKLGAKLLASTSDKGLFHGTDDSNLDVLARLANDPQALQAVNGVINQLKQAEGSDISIELPKGVRDTVLTGLKEMNFDIDASIPFLEAEQDAGVLKQGIAQARKLVATFFNGATSAMHSADPNNREFLEGRIDGMVQGKAAKMIKEAPGRQ